MASASTSSPWSLRRLKEDLKDLDGGRLFPDRHAKTVTFRLNSEEYALYKSVTAYINEFLLGQGGDIGIMMTDGGYSFDESKWVDWSTPTIQ